MPDTEKTWCGWCGDAVRRATEAAPPEGRKLVYTRTLVVDKFVPSCSLPCANELRRRARAGEVPYQAGRAQSAGH